MARAAGHEQINTQKLQKKQSQGWPSPELESCENGGYWLVRQEHKRTWRFRGPRKMGTCVLKSVNEDANKTSK